MNRAIVQYVMLALLLAAATVPPIIRHHAWKRALSGFAKTLLGIYIPFLVFLLACLLTPNWKGGCRWGWVDCFQAGKLALVPLVLWAMAAIYATEIWSPGRAPRPWSVLGILQGAVVSGVCLFHGVFTIGLDREYSWGLVVPLYVAAWYMLRTVQYAQRGLLRWPMWHLGLLGSAPFWAVSVWLSRVQYTKLPEAPPSCFVVSAAMRGHTRLVGPLSAVAGGRYANRQLVTFWRLESVWSRFSPGTHRSFRRIYNVLGATVAAHVRSPWTADAVFLLLKPMEVMARSVNYVAAYRSREAQAQVSKDTGACSSLRKG
ncbi:MAG: hypothetical protein PHR35_19090 [Kiritimatiellae bacterium]|nr:hypothetical protein [Kiritimatiellia bacterium]